MKRIDLIHKAFLLFIIYLSAVHNTALQGQCVIYNPSIIQTDCDDLGTSDPFDDLITLDVTAIHWDNDPAAMFEVVSTTNLATLGTFMYSTGGPVTINYEQNLGIIIKDVMDPDCYVTLYPAITHCSEPNDCSSPLGDFVLVGDAVSTSDSCFRLTRNVGSINGGMWYQNELDLDFDFNLSFNLNFGTRDTLGADGMIFILQTVGNNINGSGGYLGFQNLTESVGIEFDTYRNHSGSLDAIDPPQDHMSFQKNGSLVHDNSGYLDGSVPLITLANIEDGADRAVTIQWDAASMNLSCTFDGNSFSVSQDIVNTIFNGDSEVFWGWAAATGSKRNQHTVCFTEITVVDALTISSLVADVTCQSPGAIDIIVNGGVPPYTYQWSNGSNTEDLNPITAGGTYTVTVTDDCGTISTLDIPVAEEVCCEILDTIVYTSVGDAAYTDSTCYQLTRDTTWQSGQVWSQNTLNLNSSFSKSFSLNFGIRDGLGADGIMFILQADGLGAIGAGGSFGFSNFPVSAGFEFDTFQNTQAGTFNDPPMDHIGFLTNGSLWHQTNSAGVMTDTLGLDNLEDGNLHQVTISWNPVTRLFTCTIDGTKTLNVTTDLLTIFGGNPEVYWGWSGTTGTRVNAQSLCISEDICECSIEGTATQVNCVDDLITIQVDALGLNAGPSDQFTVVNVLDILGTFNYNQGGTITIPYSPSITLTFFDVDDPNCSELVTIDLTACSPECGPDTLSYVIQGSATEATLADCYQLTSTNPTYQSGQVWSENTLDLNSSFNMDFSLNFGDQDDPGADGIMFILQADGHDPIGNGGGFGFPNFPVSAGFEFDTFENGSASGNFNDPPEDHLGFLTNGSLLHPDDPLGTLLDIITLSDLEDGLPHQVSVSWDPTTMNLTCTIDAVNTLTITIDLIDHFGGNPDIFWGWSGSTGSEVNNQSVCLIDIQIDQLTMTSVVSDIKCDTPGQIDITVSGGVPPFTFQWSDGSTNEDLTNITTAGTYTVTITDFCNHTITESFTLTAPNCECSITASAYQIDCDNMGTSDPADDMITLQVNAAGVGVGPSGSFTVCDNSTSAPLGTFMYTIGGTITVPYGQSISLLFKDVDNPECSDVVELDLAPCSLPCTDVRISITLDNYPKETSWDLRNDAGVIIATSNGHLGQNPSGITLEWDYCLDDGCYYFTIYDSYGDGICCDPFYGDGSYTVSNLTTGSVYGSGGQFGFSETVNFCFINSFNTNSCPEDLDVPGVNTFIEPGTYEAAKTIESDGVIMEGDVQYSAGQSVYLMSGFEVSNGIEFNAIIEGCDPNQ